MKPVKAGVDTSAFVAAVCAWHEKHHATVAVLEDLLGGGAKLTIPEHAVLESYAVLTRLPAPHRLRPADAADLLARNAALMPECAAPKGPARKLVASWAANDIAGGRIYDLLILEAVRAAGAKLFVTLNPRDVAGFEGDIRIVVP